MCNTNKTSPSTLSGIWHHLKKKSKNTWKLLAVDLCDIYRRFWFTRYIAAHVVYLAPNRIGLSSRKIKTNNFNYVHYCSLIMSLTVNERWLMMCWGAGRGEAMTDVLKRASFSSALEKAGSTDSMDDEDAQSFVLTLQRSLSEDLLMLTLYRIKEKLNNG